MICNDDDDDDYDGYLNLTRIGSTLIMMMMLDVPFLGFKNFPKKDFVGKIIQSFHNDDYDESIPFFFRFDLIQNACH